MTVRLQSVVPLVTERLRAVAKKKVRAQDANIEGAFVAAATASRDVNLSEGGAAFLAAGHDANLTSAGTGMTAVGHDLNITEGGAGIVLVAGDAQVNDSVIVVLASPNTKLAEGTKVLFTLPLAVAFGVALGAVLALGQALFTRRLVGL